MEEEVELFKTSTIAQPKEVTEFLQKLITKNPFNKYCIDCKKNLTTHALLWLGTFVCETCAHQHLNMVNYSKQSRTYVKRILKEHWDDYQLRSI